ncbi:MAG TPA: hypothetical protein VII53_01940 [Solirubrobacteraceae bacterium]
MSLDAPVFSLGGTNFTNDPMAVSAGLDRVLFGLRPLSGPADALNLYIREPDGSFAEVGPAAPASALVDPPAGASINNVGVQIYLYHEGHVGGQSSDLSHVLFTLATPETEGRHRYLWPFDTTGGEVAEKEEEPLPSLYEYVGVGSSEPFLVGVSGAKGSASLLSRCGTSVGSFRSREAYNAVSSDGSRVFFTPWGEDREKCGSSQPPHTELFAREEFQLGSETQFRTVAISEPSKEDCTACNTTTGVTEGAFRGASEDGSKVFFTTEQELLPGDTGENLYEYDFNAPAGEKVTLVSDGVETAEVQGVARGSEDGSHVYFVAHGVLTNEPDRSLPPGHQVAVAGEDNLYVYDTSTRQTAFVAILAASDSGDWVGEGNDNHAVQATPDGRFLLFQSNAQLTADDTDTAQDIYRYDAQTGELVRISIGQSGFDKNGNNNANTASIRVVPFGQWSGPAKHSSMSDDGQYVFFSSSEGLTSQAINDPSGQVENVYEYHDGNVSLISDGQDRSRIPGTELEGAELIGTDSSGSDVFFSTSDQLVSQDGDSFRDIYDARIDGGFPAPSSPAACQGDACQGEAGPPPLLGAPSSATFSGSGNLISAVSKPAAKPKRQSKPLTRAQKLAKALNACQKQPRKSRAACVIRAKKQYGKKSKAKKSSDRRSKR